MALKTITFRVPEDKLTELDATAKIQQRDRSFVLNEAVSQYLSLHDYHRELIEEGVRQADAGDVVEHADVVRMVERMTRRKKAR